MFYVKHNFEKFKKELQQLNIAFTDRMEEQFSVYYEVLIEWNQVMNLTTITEFNEVVEKHFLDSVILGSYIDLDNELSVMDMGTGAGFPGIPLKIVYPKLHVLLADSLNKRIKFLDAVIQKLELEKISAVHGRAEDLAHRKEYREQFDLCVSRAVANLASLSEYCLPYVKEGGVFVSYKSGEVESEASESKGAIYLLGGKIRNIEKFQLPDTEYQRSFVIIDKVSHTSKKYPRKAGTPTKQPLK